MNLLISFLLLFSYLAMNVVSYAQSPIHYKDRMKPLDIWPDCYYLEDRGSLGIEHVIDSAHRFQPARDKTLSFGINARVVWLKFQVSKNQVSDPDFLTIERVSLWDAVLYHEREGGDFGVDSLGTNIPFDRRKLQVNYSVVPLERNASGVSDTYYLRLKTSTSFFIPLFLNSTTSLVQRISKTTLFHGMYVGIILILIVYNLLRLILTRQLVYFSYLIYTVALLVYQGLFNTGLGFEFLWPDFPSVNRHYAVAASCFVLSMIFFSSVFLETRRGQPRSHKVIYGLVVVFCIVIALNLAGFIHETGRVMLWLLTPTFLFLLTTGIIALVRGNLNARLYLIGWGTFIIFYFIFLLWMHGFIRHSFFGHYALFFGSIIEMLFWFFAISDKMNLSVIAERENDNAIRKEISRDFHDELGNQSARLINYISLLRLRGEIGKDAFETLSGYAKAILFGTKDFVWALDPRNDQLDRMVMHLRDFGEKMFNEKNIEFRFEGELEAVVRLPRGHSRQIVLIFKEAMTNTFNHSLATYVVFSVTIEKKRVVLQLKDDGIGLPPNAANMSERGMENMRIRSLRIGATLLVDSAPHGGTSVRLLI